MDQLSPAPLKRALGIYCVYIITYTIGYSLWESSIFHAFSAAAFSGFSIFIFASIGLLLSEDTEFEPLPLITIKNAKKVLSWLGYTVIAFILIFVVFKVVSLGVYSISVNVLGEIFPDKSYIEIYFPGAPLPAVFFLLFAGCITAEVLFRLFTMNVIWRLTKNVYIAIVISAVISGLYCLTPLDPLYDMYWRFPFYSMVIGTVMGILLGFAYKKLGFESVVVIHTLITFFG